MTSIRRFILSLTALAVVATPAVAQTTVGSLSSDYGTGGFLDWAASSGWQKYFGASMRAGSGTTSGDWELGIVDGADFPFAGAQAQQAWGGDTYDFSFTYDPFHAALDLASHELSADVSSEVGPGSVTHILARAKASEGVTGRFDWFEVFLGSGESIFSGSLFGDGDAEYVTIADARLADGFRIEGQVTLIGLERGSDPMAQFKVGQGRLVTTPEPGTLFLLIAGMGAMGIIAWRRRPETA